MRELLTQIIEHQEQAAWIEFVRKFNRVVKTTIDNFRQLDTDEREDLYQEVFIILLKNDCNVLREFRGETDGSMGAFLKEIAKNLCLASLKKAKKEPVEWDDDFIVISENSCPEKELERSQVKAELDKIIMGLPLIYRDVLMLLLKGYKVSEIAKILQIEYKTAETRITRAKGLLRKNNFLKGIFT